MKILSCQNELVAELLLQRLGEAPFSNVQDPESFVVALQQLSEQGDTPTAVITGAEYYDSRLGRVVEYGQDVVQAALRHQVPKIFIFTSSGSIRWARELARSNPAGQVMLIPKGDTLLSYNVMADLLKHTN